MKLKFFTSFLKHHGLQIITGTEWFHEASTMHHIHQLHNLVSLWNNDKLCCYDNTRHYSVLFEVYSSKQV